MPRHIMKLHDDRDNKDYYLEWSTVVDAPVTYGLSLEEFKEYYKQQYGNEGMRLLEERLSRVEEFGISALPPFDELDDYMKHNRAGEKESCINKEQIIDRFCRQHVG